MVLYIALGGKRRFLFRIALHRHQRVFHFAKSIQRGLTIGKGRLVAPGSGNVLLRFQTPGAEDGR